MYGFFFAHHGRRVAKSTPPPASSPGSLPCDGSAGGAAGDGGFGADACMCMYVSVCTYLGSQAWGAATALC